jgi:hypothetical protein
MKNLKRLALMGACALSLGLAAGCVNTLDGHKQAGNPFVNDIREGRYEFPLEKVFSAAKEVLAQDGTLKGENRISNALEATVDQRSVWVRVEEVDPKVTRVLVQCRTKGGGADLALASEIDKRIALRLASTR